MVYIPRAYEHVNSHDTNETSSKISQLKRYLPTSRYSEDSILKMNFTQLEASNDDFFSFTFYLNGGNS